MAEEEGKNPVVWPKEATEASDFDFMMVGKNDDPIMKIKKEKLNEIIVVQGESMPAIQGGTTAATAVALPAGPTGQNRWFDASWGYWKYNNTVLKNPLGTDGIPQGNEGTLYWDGTALIWKISKMQPLPQATGTSTLNPDGTGVPQEQATDKYIKKIAVLNSGLTVFNKSKNLVDLKTALGGKVINSNLNGNNVNPINVSTNNPTWRTLYFELEPLTENNAYLLVQGWNSVRNDIYWGKGTMPDIPNLTIAQGLAQLVTSGSLSNLGLPGKNAGKTKLKRPETATWFGINIKNDAETDSVFSSLMISYGKEDTDFPDYSPMRKQVQEINGIPLAGLDSLSSESLTIESSKNKFDKSTLHSGYITDSGYVADGGTTYKYTDPIDVSKMPNNLFLSSAGNGSNTGYRYITAFDKNGVLLADKGANSGANTLANKYTKDDSVHTIIVSMYAANADTFQIESGDSRTTYEPYKLVVTKINGVPLASIAVVAILISLIAEGDSTTEGADLVSMLIDRWTTLLQIDLGSAYSVINRGTSGARAEEIVARIGGNRPKIKIPGGVLTPGTRAALTYLDIEPLRAGGSNITYSYPCAIYDYNGPVAHGYMTKTNSVNGFVSTETTVKNVDPNKEYYLVSTANKELSSNGTKLDRLKDVIILGMGANNISLIQNGTQTVDFLKQQWTNAFSAYPNIMSWGQTDRGISELAIINEVEDFLISKYGNKFCPVRRYLASSQALVDAVKIQSDFVPTQTDLDRVAAGSIAPSLKSSAGSAHLNALGHKLQMNFMKNWLTQFYI